MKKYTSPSLIATAIAMALSTASYAEGITETVSAGKVNFDSRLRYETVEQNNTLDAADALTLRIRLGYTTAEFSGFFGALEFEGSKAIVEDYNSTINGKTNYSTIVDPDFEEINQSFIGYKGLGQSVIKYGRQRLSLDNHRFIGNVGWRQNEQTFDGFSFVNSGLQDTTINVAYLTNANRIFSDDSSQGNYRMQSPILNVSYKGLSFATITGYGYFLDFDKAIALSSETVGVRFVGKAKLGEKNSFNYTVEVARQEDYGSNLNSFSHDYVTVEAGVDINAFTAKVAYELLGGDGTTAFQTPLATLHAFNGWTDQFLSTPVGGLEDINVSVGATFSGAKASLIYHEFSADTGGNTYGNEIGFSLSKSFDKNYALGLKLAQYSADGFSVDTDKIWIWGEMKF